MTPLRFLPLLCACWPFQLSAADYQALLQADQPVATWSFAESSTPGPRPPQFPQFAATNMAGQFGSAKTPPLRIPDPTAKSPFDFELGETISLEAWVQCRAIKDGQQIYIIGKGRTQNPGVAANNQNWALRLRGQNGGAAALSFLFRDARNRPDSGDADWHRWTTLKAFAPGEEWHHLAVSYIFGQPESVRGYIDGVECPGAWDMGGPTALGPVVDNDEVWIGSSMGGAPQASFNGLIDEIALYRKALSPKTLQERAQRVGAVAPLTQSSKKPSAEGDPVPPPRIPAADLPKGLVRVEVLEHPGAKDAAALESSGGNDSGPPKDNGGLDASWSTLPAGKTDEYTQNAFAFSAVTEKYNEHGVKVDRSRPFLVRAAAVLTLPPGEHRLLLRSLTGARLAWDGAQLAVTEHLKRRSGDTEAVPDQAAKMAVPGVRLLPAGHHETLATVQSDGKPHVLSLEAFVGGKGIRPELGELSVAISTAGGPWLLLQPSGTSPAFDNRGWTNLQTAQTARLEELNAIRRHPPAEKAYWQMRHQLARQHARPAAEPPPPASANDSPNPVDRFLAARLKAADLAPAPPLSDAAFLRRASLDVTGVIPAPDEVQTFLANSAPNKRAAAIDRLLKDPRWADRWTPYWQDVLAENPNMLKGMLNNTGPFRYWLHEALRDNLPLDRFVTELVSMEGSAQYGGPAGFGIASQNDLPMAAKAQIISSAFLAMEMKCARCHDAPNHPYDQADLLSVAAMLQRRPIKVPASSLTQGLSENSHVVVSLKPGQPIEAHWPFRDLPSEPLPGVLRETNDPRERLAALLTDPRNDRFAQVAVNRLWRELIGFGLVDPVEDWENASPSHPELLAWLGRELITHNYDLKHVARIILNSRLYQTAATAAGSRLVKSRERLFEAPARRRLTAEQLVDSLFELTGTEFDTEMLTMDPECRQSAADHANLGAPRRSWQFTGLSNERDRPALAKPRAQVIGDVLAAFGWREARAEPRSARDHDANVLQPALLANGTLGSRLTRLSEDHAVTALALRDQSVEEFVNQVFLRVLSRPPKTAERARAVALLTPGYETRRTGAPAAVEPPRIAKAVSWANHLNPDATNVVLAIEKEVQSGLPPSARLQADWRERAEDLLWALLVSPEFIHLP